MVQLIWDLSQPFKRTIVSTPSDKLQNHIISQKIQWMFHIIKVLLCMRTKSLDILSMILLKGVFWLATLSEDWIRGWAISRLLNHQLETIIAQDSNNVQLPETLCVCNIHCSNHRLIKLSCRQTMELQVACLVSLKIIRVMPSSRGEQILSPEMAHIFKREPAVYQMETSTSNKMSTRRLIDLTDLQQWRKRLQWITASSSRDNWEAF